MHESYREQHPLLCDDISDEEIRPQPYSAQYHQRLYHMRCNGRSKNQIKGVAAVIGRWPEHWSSVTYWWTLIGMIAITFFIIYNSVVAFALLPSTYLKATKPHISNNKADNATQGETLPDVFMHLFAEQDKDVDLNKYLPYIEIIKNKYLGFRYQIIIIMNDTLGEANIIHTPEENNEIALNTLWNKEYIKQNKWYKRSGITIKHITLSTFFDNSPLRKYWRQLPHHFIKFLTRAVSIWDKGGIAFNPDILTPRSPNPMYIEKLHNIFQMSNIKCTDEFHNRHKYDLKTKKQNKSKKTFNNIRDIINALESNATVDRFLEQNLIENENKDNLLYKSGDKYKLLHKMPVKHSNSTHFEYNVPKDNTYTKYDGKHVYKANLLHRNMSLTPSDITGEKKNMLNETGEKINKLSLLPIFRDYLLHDESKIRNSMTNSTETQHIVTKKRTITVREHKVNTSLLSNNTSKKPKSVIDIIEYKPIVISSTGLYNLEKTQESDVYFPNKHENSNRLTIDLKGNILATETACHAFIGTVFSDVVNHSDDETLTEFLIAELSSFCKGLLSSCNGIDVILL